MIPRFHRAFSHYYEVAWMLSKAPAAEVEALVASAVRSHVEDYTEGDDRDLIRNHVVRIDLQVDELTIELKAGKASSNPRNAVDNDRLVLRIPWKKTSMKRRREIIVLVSVSAHELRPMRAETRATLIAAIARGRRWLDEVVAGTVTGVEKIAAREKCSIRQVNMTISLAFLAPKLVQATVEGQLPRGIAHASTRCSCRVVAPICDARCRVDQVVDARLRALPLLTDIRIGRRSPASRVLKRLLATVVCATFKGSFQPALQRAAKEGPDAEWAGTKFTSRAFAGPFVSAD